VAKHTHFDSMVPLSIISQHSASQRSGTSLHSIGRHPAGSQNVENMQLHTRDDSRLNGHSRSDDRQDEGDKMTEGQLFISQGHSRSQDMTAAKQLVAEGQPMTDEGHSRSREGRSRSYDGRCVYCGCVRSVATDSVPAININTELGQTQGSAATPRSRSGGQNTVLQGESGSPGGVQGRVSSDELRSGGESERQGKVSSDELRSGGHEWFDMESYSGVVSRELCQQLDQLLSDLNAATDLNLQVIKG